MTAALMTARQLAELLDVSAETVLRWTRRGDLPAFRLPGGAIRYREPAVEQWLASRQTTLLGEPQISVELAVTGELDGNGEVTGRETDDNKED